MFSQIIQLLSREDFRKIVQVYDGDKYTKTLDCWQQLVVLLYAQIKDLKSLKEIFMSFSSHKERWEILGLCNVARSTLSDANAERYSEIFEKLFYKFLEKCHEIVPKHRFSLNVPVFINDALFHSVFQYSLGKIPQEKRCP